MGMAIDRHRFLAIFVVSNVLITATLAGVVAGGVAVAVPTAGVGGFTVEFQELQGEGFQQYATLENNSECQAYPSAVAQIDRGTITGLRLYKDVTVPKSMPGGGNTVRMVITSDETVKFSGLTQKFTYLDADLTFDDGQKITTDAGKDDGFGIDADSITIEDADIKVQSQFVNSITLEGSTVQTKVNPDHEADFPKSACAAGGNSSEGDA
ncbi:DUF6230 family protein [Haloarchaeobius sp. TZWSO28]|uniref:DUF6230 family protein n=1 Tax=Haloarchaeobius sp. TZWSO28 TaxID=3446119 RepID=UPI003EB8A591